MRLLRTDTGEFQWEEHPQQIKYAILSHVWRKPEGEQSYQDVVKIQVEVRDERAKNPGLRRDEVVRRLSSKIRDACLRARHQSFKLIWIDSCCIDKSSSAELSEAINSMYAWYAAATLCYALLSDVASAEEDPYLPGSSFSKSAWFTRGWTLQELIAPGIVMFYAADWCMIGGKHGLAGIIEEVTGIDSSVLTGRLPPKYFSVAQRMSWASKRVTTRKEDEAYCLMGIFGVNMPTIYGEGDMAFLRLQEEILKVEPDQSIFAWDYLQKSPLSDIQRHALLAPGPAAFANSGYVRALDRDAFTRILSFTDQGLAVPHPSYATTPHGIRTNLPYVRLPDSDICMIPLACEDIQKRDEFKTLALLITRSTRLSDTTHEYFVGCSDSAHYHAHRNSLNLSRWPREVATQGARLAFLPQGRHEYCISESIYIARSAAAVPLLLQRRQPDTRSLHYAQSDMLSFSNDFDIALNPRYNKYMKSLGYTFSFEPKTTSPGVVKPVIVVELPPYSVGIAFWLVGAEHPLHRSQEGDAPADGEHIRKTLLATYHVPLLLPVVPEQGDGMAVRGETAQVESWKCVGRSWPRSVREGENLNPPREDKRSRDFPLPPRSPGKPETMRLTMTRESPGSARYPALYSLTVEVL